MVGGKKEKERKEEIVCFYLERREKEEVVCFLFLFCFVATRA
jgi:hypothetical protein